MEFGDSLARRGSVMKTNRRHFFSQAGALASATVASGCDVSPQNVQVLRPGMELAHQFRAGKEAPAWKAMGQGGSLSCDIAIVGSGAAGLMALWQLREAGVKSVILLEGPSKYGNAGETQLGSLACPTGAHYLPLPSIESAHVRQMLSSMGVMSGPINASKPSYAEEVLVHAPAERLLHGGRWFNSILPHDSLSEQQRKPLDAFLVKTRELATAVGNDGKRVFVVPVALASSDARWRALDTLSFAQWLLAEGFDGDALRWYLDYCCRDEFGAGIDTVSAWAGLHYFCSRNGRAANAPDGTVLTWPNGLATLAQFLQKGSEHQCMPLTAVNIERQTQSVRVWATDGKQQIQVQARKVILATPLFASLAIDPEITASFTDARRFLPQCRPWLVSNFHFHQAPLELPDSELSWDNVVYGSASLGFVNAASQLMRRTPRPSTVLTSYHAFSTGEATQQRQWCSQGSPEQLLEVASQDLVAAYGAKALKLASQIQLTVHGHGMPCPTPNFLSNPLYQALRQQTGQVLYAHSDLSGYSVFEEATWWGLRAAHCCVS